MARGTTVLAEYTEFTGNFPVLAAQWLAVPMRRRGSATSATGTPSTSSTLATVITAYIHCIRNEKHLLHRDGRKVFLEDTYNSAIFKRDDDDKLLITYKEQAIRARVDDYLDHDMVIINPYAGKALPALGKRGSFDSSQWTETRRGPGSKRGRTSIIAAVSSTQKAVK